MTQEADEKPGHPAGNGVSRRQFLATAVGAAGTFVCGSAASETLLDVPPRQPGDAHADPLPAGPNFDYRRRTP
jgi:hypothetical protein